MSNRVKKQVVSVLLAVVACLALAGCAAKTIESFYGKPANKQQIDSMMEQMLSIYSAYYSDIDYEIHGNDITYKYYYSESVSASGVDALKKGLATQDFSSMIKSTKDDIEKEAGIRPTSITFAYYTSSGTPVYSITE
jgi:hypothetical protein